MFSRIKSPAKPYRLQLKLKKIGQQLRQLIQLDDIDSELKALQLIDMHQQESDVINAQHFHQSPPLILACELGKTKIVERLLATKCIDVNLMGRSKNNALQVAFILFFLQ